MHRSLRLLLLALGCVFALAAAGCGNSGAAAEGDGSGQPIRIGYAGGFTGPFEAFDGPGLIAAKIAVDEINRAGGVKGRKIEIVTADTKSDINQGSRAGLELVQENVDAMLVSPDFNFGGPAAREAQKAGKVSISVGAGSPEMGVQGIGPLAYTMGVSGLTDGALSAEWGYEKKKFRTAYVLMDDITDYNKDQCRAFETRWKELGGQVLGRDTFNNADPSVAAQVTRIKRLSSKPDLISLCSFPPGGALALKQLRDAGVDSAVVSNVAMDGDFWFAKTMPKLSDFYYLSSASMWGNDPSDAVNEFVAAYKAESGQPQTTFAMYAYAGVQAIARAIEKAGSTEGPAMAAEMNKFDKEPLVIAVTFSPDVHIDVARETRIIGVQNGKRVVDEVRTVEKQPALFGN
jgi:branched-chain amino acid transport system substrate-binding protein